MGVATLLVIQGVDEGTRFDLGDEPADIGRGVRNAVRIIDTEVSRQHARISGTPGRFFVEDLDSSNGTIVNGDLIRKHRLATGDRIQVGRTVLVFSDTSSVSQAASGMVDMVRGAGATDESQIVSQIDDSVEMPLLDNTHVERSDKSRIVVNLNLLYRISEEIVRPSVASEEMLQRVLTMVISDINADRGCILLRSNETGEFVPKAFHQRVREPNAVRMPVSRTIVDYVRSYGQGVRTSDARRDDRFDQGKSILQAGIREALCVPMQSHSEMLGVIYLDTTSTASDAVTNPSGASRFTEDHLRLLLAVGRQAALAVESNRYQDALVKAERLAAMGQTIAMLSHHIKNILQGVRGGSYLIDMGLQNTDDQLVRKGWGIVERNQNKIYHLVMDMLTFSKERTPVLEATDLNTLAADVCELMMARSEECDVKFEFEQGDGIPVAQFDPEGIHRAILNVVTNAIDAVESSEDGRVKVETGFDSETELLYVAVSDNGPGIPDEQMAGLFSIFESTKGARGTGLGLAVSKKILHEHGGEITVESEVGAGCRFTLAWPAGEDEAPASDHQTMPGV